MFMFLAEFEGEEIVSLRTDLLDSEMLRKTHASITSGWQVNKKHWIAIRARRQGCRKAYRLTRDRFLPARRRKPAQIRGASRPSSI